LVDEFLIYLAPKLLGPGLGMASLGPLQTLSEGVALQFQSIDRVGVDLRVMARVAGPDQF
jgi:diaminohydroxyphosphoribosylaminopyrimidine deaminase/5-amino-6-(5-phosphoribosylamino)uracil reductase